MHPFKFEQSSELNKFFLPYNRRNKRNNIPKKRHSGKRNCCGCKRLGNTDFIADRGNVAGVQRCVVGQGYYQVSTVVNAASFNTETVFSVLAIFAIGTIFTIDTIFPVRSDDFSEIGYNSVGKGEDKAMSESV